MKIYFFTLSVVIFLSIYLTHYFKFLKIEFIIKNESQVLRKNKINEYNSIKNKIDGKNFTTKLFANTSSPTKKNNKKFPQALIIGEQKCGTTALTAYLRIHPNIRICNHARSFEKKHQQDIKCYKNIEFLSKSNNLAIEKSVDYFTDRTLPKRVYEQNKNMKLILIIRNPVTRIISHFTHLLANNKSIELDGPPSRSFETVADYILKNIHQNNNTSILDRCKYSFHYKNWLEYFPKAQILIVDGENLIVNPYHEIKKIEKFLKLKKFFRQDNFVFVKKKGFYCIKKSKFQKPKCLKSDKGRKHPNVSHEIKKTLSKIFEPLDDEFFNLAKLDKFW